MKTDVLKSQSLWEIDNTDKNLFVNVNEIYIGILAYESLSFCSETERTIILENCREFYIEVVTQIKSRFGFSDEIYTILDVVDPKNAQSFQPKSLFLFKKRFPSFNMDLQKLDNEWRQHGLLDFDKYELHSDLEPDVYWRKVFKLKNNLGEDMFPILQKVINFILILPFSNASVERIFSTLNICKTDLRNRLSSETVTGILFTKQGIERNGNEHFEPSLDLCNQIWK